MKERKKANPKTIKGMRVPQSMHSNRFGEYRSPICNFSNQCVSFMTNYCTYCIRNFSTWKQGSYVIKKDDKNLVKPSGKMVPTLQSDFYVKKPENT